MAAGLLFALVVAEAEMAIEKHFWEEFRKASPEMQKWMMEKREKERLERIEERRHQEQIRAQEKIAKAIRFAAIMR